MRAPVILFWPTLNLHYKQREWGWERRRDNHTTPSQFFPLKWQNRTTCGIQPEAIWITELCCLMAPPNYCGPSGTWIVMVTSWGLLSDTFHWILLHPALPNQLEIRLQDGSLHMKHLISSQIHCTSRWQTVHDASPEQGEQIAKSLQDGRGNFGWIELLFGVFSCPYGLRLENHHGCMCWHFCIQLDDLLI